MFEHLAMWTFPHAVRTEEPERMIERLRAARVDIIVPFVDSRARGDEQTWYEDRLRAIIEQAHRHGMQVHACFDDINAYEAMPVYHLRQVRQDGTFATGLCPANPEAREYILGSLERVLTEFDYDGVNLEDGYVYHQNTIYDPAHQAGVEYRVIPVCYCDYCRQHAPIEQPEWNRWKQERLSELIGMQAELIRLLRPGIPFSVAARMPYAKAFYAPFQQEIPYYGGWEFCQSRDGFGADWAEWLRRGYLDSAWPMSYFHSQRMIELQTQECRAMFPQGAQTIWMGLVLSRSVEFCASIGQFPDGPEQGDPALFNDAPRMAELLADQVRLGQRNCVLFTYEQLLDEHIPILAQFRPS
ncbi:MAG: family 10 glycosylhydrolase [Armatimonadota bacterium]